MSPPTEQLIRDYLNRLSVAARGQLDPDDRRALMNRTRDLIERKTGLAGPPTAMEVGALLARLGDPSGLVRQERQRLAAVRGELPQAAASRPRFARVLRRDATRVRTPSWHWPVQEGSRADLQLTLLDGATLVDAPADPASTPGRAARTTIATGAGTTGAGTTGAAGSSDAGKGGAGASTAAETNGAGASTAAETNGSGTSTPAGTNGAEASTAAGTTAAGTTAAAGTDAAGSSAPEPLDPKTPATGVHAASNGIARNGVAREPTPAGADEPAARVPAQASEPSWFMLALGGREPGAADQSDDASVAPDPPAGVPAKPRWPSAPAGADEGTRRLVISDSTASGEPADPSLLTTRRDPVLSRQAHRVLSALATWFRRSPLEASAVVLLGLGGVIYPPVWLAGAALALASRLWDYRDKWLGLALPLLVTLIGTAVGVANGGHVSVSQGVHEGWVYGVVTSRLAAVLSAAYLGWRSIHGRRPPAVPPWNKPHKIG
jgi:hypothetical protein